MPTSLDSDPVAMALASRAASGEALSRDEARALASADLFALGAAADEVRAQLHGNHAVLVPVEPFRWNGSPAEPPVEGLPGSPPVFPAELRFSDDLPADMDLPGVREAIRAARRAFPGVPVRALRPTELVRLAEQGPRSAEALLRTLAEDGLATTSHPARGDDAAATRRGLLAAHAAGLATDAPLPYAASTTVDELVDRILDLRALSENGAPFRSLVPLPAEGPTASPLVATTGIDDLRVFALGRLLLPRIPRVTVEADIVGRHLGAVALSFGADSLAGALARPTARLRAADGEKPRPLNVPRAHLLLLEVGRIAVDPPPFPGE
jgi:aminodeoxyfutalosine synthase